MDIPWTWEKVFRVHILSFLNTKIRYWIEIGQNLDMDRLWTNCEFLPEIVNHPWPAEIGSWTKIGQNLDIDRL